MAKQKKTEDANESKEKKEDILESTIKDIQSKFGEGAIMKLGEAPRVDVEVIPTGSISLDLALGVGGMPRGRIIEIYGPESSGKTTLALHIVASAQKQGGKAAFIDAEHALDPEYAKRIGVKTDELLISQPDNGEEALNIMEQLVRSGSIDVIVVDSVAALTPRAEIEGEMGAQHIGLQARLMSQALRKITAIAAKTKTVIIFINQIRMQVGI
ncbi:MAG TPA: recombinase RecA, partial [Candidatus Paceibacterota bacterium]|nr:recombinase RecA [Candidatus Paceibacterota bacterium]